MSLTVSEHVDPGAVENSDVYTEEAYDGKQMLEMIVWLPEDFMMDVCFPTLKSAGCSHCSDCMGV